jgi:protein TonB
MKPNAHLVSIRGALIVSMFALCGATAMAADGKWVEDTKSCAPPEYPRESLSKGEQGTTGLRILVGVDGKAIDSEIETSSRSRKLDSAAQRALMECSFKPQPADAKPAQQWVKTEFVWKLN